MSPMLNRQFWTPLLAVSGGVLLVSGLLLFFHFKSHAVKGIHEWAGIVFIVACAAHLVLNWKPLLKTLGRRFAWVLLAVILLSGLGMAFSGIEDGHKHKHGEGQKHSRGIRR